MTSQPLATQDPAVAALIRRETERQNDGLELIASENFVSPAVRDDVVERIARTGLRGDY